MERNAGKKFQKSYFDVLGLCCSSEVPMIERILNSLDGVKGFSVVVPTRTLIVVHDSLLISQIQIVKALNESRLEASIRVYGHSNYKNKWPSPYAVTCGVLLVLSFLKYVYNPFKWLAIVAVLAGIPPVLLKALAAVRNLRVDINILVLITVSGSLALHDYWEAATIVFLFTISEWLESRASHKATSEMSSLISVVPQKAVIAETGEEINADEVKLGTVLAVKAGQVIPIDGVVIEGSCEVDEKIMTGESFPVTKQKDSAVWASTINLNGYISIKTTAVAEDCVVARMAKIVEEAQNKKSETQRFLDKCAKYYTPAIVVISASIALVPLAFHVRNKREWYHLALVVLVSGCPCALLLSTPVAMFCALSKAATLGVLFKGAQHLETLARIKIMAFDKTGTITRGEFLVVDLKSLMPEISSDELLYWISSIESKSSHPMAAALVDFARTHSIEPKPDKVENFQNFPGEGISGKIEDSEIYIGNSKIALRAGCTSVPKLEGYDTEGKSVGYVFLGSSPAAIFCLSDTCRTVAKETIQQLKSSGIKTVMLTGDCHGAAKLAQEQLGGALEVIRAELLPEEKASMIKEFQKENPTAMIGDGLNDSPALATADIGISMGISGSALATESGDIVLMTNDIRRVPKALRIAKQVRRKVIENVILSISTKAAIVGLAIAGHPLVWAAVLADVGTCLLVIFNSMLILRVKSCCDSTKHSHSHKHESKNKNCHSAHSHSCNEDRIEDRQCCNKGDHDVESQKPHHHGCCSSSSVSEHRHPHPHSEGTVMNDSLHIHRHNDLQNEDKVEDHEDTVSQKPHHHGCCSSSSISEHRHPHTHSEGTVKNDSVHIHDHCPKTKKCFSSMKEHGHKHTDLQNEGKLEDHQCCNKGDHDLESQKTHYHGCCTSSSTSEHRHPHPHSEGIVMNDSVHIHDHCPETKKCSSSMKEHGHKHTDLQNEGKVEDHEHTVSHNHGCSENHNHRNSCEGQEKQKCKDHTHSKSNEGSWWKNVGNREHCRHKKQESGESGVCRGSKTMKLGCCDSFRRECCIRNGSHLRGLSEIFID